MSFSRNNHISNVQGNNTDLKKTMIKLTLKQVYAINKIVSLGADVYFADSLGNIDGGAEYLPRSQPHMKVKQTFNQPQGMRDSVRLEIKHRVGGKQANYENYLELDSFYLIGVFPERLAGESLTTVKLGVRLVSDQTYRLIQLRTIAPVQEVAELIFPSKEQEVQGFGNGNSAWGKKSKPKASGTPTLATVLASKGDYEITTAIQTTYPNASILDDSFHVATTNLPVSSVYASYIFAIDPHTRTPVRVDAELKLVDRGTHTLVKINNIDLLTIPTSKMPKRYTTLITYILQALKQSDRTHLNLPKGVGKHDVDSFFLVLAFNKTAIVATVETP